MEDFILTTDDVRKVYFGGSQFPEDDIDTVEYLIDVVLEDARALIEDDGRDLEEEIEAGRLRSLSVKNVLSTVVKRTYDAAIAGGSGSAENISQASQSAGPYSFSFTPAKSEYSIYFKKDEKRRLGVRAPGLGAFRPY